MAQGIRTAIEGIPKQPEPTLTSSLILSGEEVAKVKTEPKVTVEEDLSSEKGVNYIRLRDLLKVNKWRDADYETYLMMLQAVGRQKGDWIRSEELANFPLTDLRTVNQLWMKYSNGHFGFSVQKRIYESIGGHLDGEYDYQTLEKFGDRVQWRINSSWITYNSLIFSLNAPEGYLPVLPCGFGIREWEKGRSFWIGWGLSDLRLSSLLQHQDL
ncbi:MAG: GUN4 domain-containing protein [Leptolyngbyaceae cyanobacterium SM1_4_3]|nr:GUN4 domain-containing protein [Leptolyngbyaceae cyanobacterium SM1_4_3]NJN91674.1 GUN4 domain-containing protein [Leptolyngbyaceae cyanobacterium SL_5_14]